MIYTKFRNEATLRSALVSLNFLDCVGTRKQLSKEAKTLTTVYFG